MVQVRPGWGTPTPEKVDRRTHSEFRHGETPTREAGMTEAQAQAIIDLLTEMRDMLRRSDELRAQVEASRQQPTGQR